MKDSISSIMSRKTALMLNALIVAAYIGIAVLASTPWVMFGGFLLMAIVIRCATLWWMTSFAQGTEDSPKFALGLVFLNLVFGLLFAGALLGILWWSGHYWLAGIKIIVPLLAVFVAYKSTFPVISRSSGFNDSKKPRTQSVQRTRS